MSVRRRGALWLLAIFVIITAWSAEASIADFTALFHRPAPRWFMPDVYPNHHAVAAGRQLQGVSPGATALPPGANHGRFALLHGWDAATATGLWMSEVIVPAGLGPACSWNPRPDLPIIAQAGRGHDFFAYTDTELLYLGWIVYGSDCSVTTGEMLAPPGLFPKQLQPPFERVVHHRIMVRGYDAHGVPTDEQVADGVFTLRAVEVSGVLVLGIFEPLPPHGRNLMMFTRTGPLYREGDGFATVWLGWE